MKENIRRTNRDSESLKASLNPLLNEEVGMNRLLPWTAIRGTMTERYRLNDQLFKRVNRLSRNQLNQD